MSRGGAGGGVDGPGSTRGRGAAVVGLFASFAGLGVTASLFPALLPLLGEGLGLSSEGALAGIPLLFAGLFAGVLVSSATASVVRGTFVLAAGSALRFVGIVLLVTAGGQPALLAAATVAGFGFGLAEASASARARELGGLSTPALLAALTAAVAVAAAVCPAVVALLLAPAAVPAFAVAVGAVHLVGVALTLGAVRPTPPGDAARQSTARKGTARLGTARRGTARQGTAPGQHGQPTLSARLLLPAAVALFLYVGVESTFSGWSAAVPRDLLDLTARSAALGTSAFWVLMAGGRYLAVAALRWGIRSSQLLRCCCLLSGLGLVIAALAGPRAPGLALTAMALATLGLGPCYALLLSSGLTHLDGTAARRATGLLVAAGSAGGSLLPGVVVVLALDPAGPVALLAAAALLLVVLAAGATATATATATARRSPRARKCRTDAPPGRRR